MIVGILKEIKSEENRVAMTPAGVEVMRQHGHIVIVEKGAGCGSGFEDQAYLGAGAEIIDSAAQIYKSADMVMHVKEPQPVEYDMIRADQIVFTYLHLAAAEELTYALMKRGSVNIAYETIQKKDGSLPLLTPMSEVAGRMATQHVPAIGGMRQQKCMRRNEDEIEISGNGTGGGVFDNGLADRLGNRCSGWHENP